MAPRRQLKQHAKSQEKVADITAEATPREARSKRVKLEPEDVAAVSVPDVPTRATKKAKIEPDLVKTELMDPKEEAKPHTEDSPVGASVRTTRSLRGKKSQLETPEASKLIDTKPSKLIANVKAEVKDEEDPGAFEDDLKVPKIEQAEMEGGEELDDSTDDLEEKKIEQTGNEDGEELTAYERERRETMARNKAMLEALGVEEAAQGLGSEVRARKARAAAKGLQTVRARKEKKELGPVRRSSRIQHIAPESSTAGGIDRENRDGSVILHGQEAPFRGPKSAAPSPWDDKARIQGPIKFESSNTDDPASDAAFLDTLKRLRDDRPLRAQSADVPTADPTKLTLKENDVARLVKDRIFAVEFLPVTDKVIVAAGDKSGGLGIWDVDADDANDGVQVFNIGPRPISALSVSKRDCTKLYSCSFDGSLRVLDVDKGVFAEAYVDEGADFSAMTLGPLDGGHVAYVGDGDGALTVVDLRASTAQVTYQMHGRKINTIDFNPQRPHVFVTGGTDAVAHIWDVRKLPENESQRSIHPLTTLPHVKAVNSIYFSPDGTKLASTSYDNQIRVYDDMLDVLASDAAKVKVPQPLMISHYNNTGRWISSFRAVWTWDSRHVAVGSMNRAIDVIDVSTKRLTRLASEHMPTIPARNAVHPLLPIIAGGVAGGRVHIWR